MTVDSVQPEADPAADPPSGVVRAVARFATVAVVVGAATLAACGSSTPEGVIDRDTFVDAYVELRISALETDSSKVAAADRERILADRGITEEDMLDFVRAHATDLEFMRDVWNDVELRLDQPPPGVADEG